MAAWIRNDTWKCDEELKRDLEGYVKQALKRDEVLDFVSKKYLMYAWSLRTLCCRLHYFDLLYGRVSQRLGTTKFANLIG